ncbi:hypothetical protein D9611_010743 [Ephemerocybe angulata]|uniref:Thymidylate synthase/dCMP hydroxymethylase domain-containing protein n=1 Tax=Ephemerocybe angulata TaxID=980116 RepID=A0A8H5F1U3_9AGAR|nr:hypothetical protein D9611_010744 [Tulosesus angulatus]KAF5320493.1 hypothetical protein D9611_010743 [Tulosesus angulatus]
MTVTAVQHEEHQYLALIRRVLDTGEARPDRTGTGTLALFAPPSLRFTPSSPPNARSSAASSMGSSGSIMRGSIWMRMRIKLGSALISSRSVLRRSGRGDTSHSSS